jgi:catechol 2,3-dioxygenase-like lactoylglutathione lyase family enzyme
MVSIVAPSGLPLGIAIISCAELERSLHFYRDLIGFDAAPVEVWRGAQFEMLWQQPSGARARASLLTASGNPVGRILLLEFAALKREIVQPRPSSAAFGLNNINFYVRDVKAVAEDFAARGYVFWSEPTQHSLTTSVGNPVEVIFDGPDSVAINLVQLASTDPATRIGQMRAYVEQHGYTRTGFTPVVTSSHVCRDLPSARRFYENVLRMGALIDEEMSAAHVNAFLRLPADARTHITFMQGNNMFGKLALSGPLNYADRCDDLTVRAHAPNIGYLAQAFEVPDVDIAYAAAIACGSPTLLRPVEFSIPGLGRRRLCVLRNPGSGALQWLLGPPSR